ncbi:MAG: VWA domain-containing protein [Bacteroidaceae bacterium]|nr:VWA domain-containing protein [Bacteroidaceae bacterium]
MNTPKERRLKGPMNMKSPKTFEQLGILVLDGSGSMEEETRNKISKAAAVSEATQDLFSRFKISRISRNFSFAIVNYDHRAEIAMQPTEMKDIDDHADYNPMKNLGGATYISEGLKKAKDMAVDFLAEENESGLTRSVVVVLMTDGVDMTEAETVSVAKQLVDMEHVDVCGCFFETLGADHVEMKKCADYIKGLCSEERLYADVADSEDLRKFFIASMSNGNVI